MKRTLLAALLVLNTFFIQAQTWQNISKQKGAVGVKTILQDSKGRLFLFCPKGVYTSTNKGDNWALLGRNFFSEGKKMDPTFDIRTQNRLYLINDTVYFFFQTYNNGNTNYYDTYKSMCFDEKQNMWKSSNRYFNPGVYADNMYQTKKLFAFLIRDVGGNSANTLSFSDDGMKTWKSTLLETYKFANFDITSFDDKLFLFKSDSSFLITNDGIKFRKKKSNSGIRPTRIVNGQLITFGYDSHYEFNTNNNSKYVYDSLSILQLDTLSGNWSVKSKMAIPLVQKYNPSYQLTSSGILYTSLGSDSIPCKTVISRSKDMGKTWELVDIRDEEKIQNTTTITSILELGGKTYLLGNDYYNHCLINSTSTSPNVFETTSPLDFGFQSNSSFPRLSASRNYIGNHFESNNSASICRTNRWNGKTWEEFEISGEKRLSERTRINTQNYFIIEGSEYYSNYRYKYYLTKDEGINWVTINRPHNRLNPIVITETGGTLLAASNYTDTIFVSSDEGKTWKALLGPTSIFSSQNTDTKEVHVDFHGNNLYLFHLKGTEKRIYSSSDFGVNWNDITYDYPQSLRLFVGGGSSNLFKHAFKKPTLSLNSTTTSYRYYFEPADKKWKVADSNYYYWNAEFKLDTLLRLDIKNKNIDNSFKLELSYDTQNWFDVSNIAADLLKGDTIAFSPVVPFDFNRLGLFVETNYGLFFSEYPSPTGIENSPFTGAKELHIYPNPASNILEMSPKGELVTIEISDLQGKLVQNTINWDTNKSFDISGFKEGVYIVKLKGNRERYFKLIKE